MAIHIPTAEEVKDKVGIFETLEYKAKGGFKVVYAGTIRGILEAVKLSFIPQIEDSDIEKMKARNEEDVKRIIREIGLIEKCNSNRIVKLGSLKPIRVTFDDKNYVAYSEEFIKGDNLAKLIGEKYKPSEAELRSLSICLLEAVDYIWGTLKTVHRDIKPLNVMKTTDIDRPFILLDFGIAYVLTETNLTIDASLRWPPGTFSNIAPEMFQPKFRDTLDYRSDLYNIGLTLYEYATCLQPFRKSNTNEMSTAYDIVNVTPVPIIELRNDLTEEFTQVVDQLLKKLPAVRPGNIKQLIKKMENTL